MHRKTRGTHLLLAKPRDLASARTKENPISLRSTVPRYLNDSVPVACLDAGGQEQEHGATSLAMVLVDVVGFTEAVAVVDVERFARPAPYCNGVIVRALHFRIALGPIIIICRSTSHRHFLPSLQAVSRASRLCPCNICPKWQWRHSILVVGGCYSNGDCHALMISSVIHRGCGGGGRCGGGGCCRSCPRRSCNCCGEMLLAESRILLFLEKWDPTNGRVREKEMSVRCEPSEPLYCLQDIKNPRSRCRRKVPSLIRSR